MPFTVVISIVWSSVPVFHSPIPIWLAWKILSVFQRHHQIVRPADSYKVIYSALCVCLFTFFCKSEEEYRNHIGQAAIAGPDIADWKMCSLQCRYTEKAFSCIDCLVTHLSRTPSSSTSNTQTQMALVKIQIFISLFYANNELFLQNQSKIVLNN